MNTPVEQALPTTSKGQAPRDGLGPAPPQRMTGKDSPQFLRAASPIQHVTWSHQHIATIIRAEYAPDQTQFVTPDHYYQQAGFVVYAKGGDIRRHSHLPLQRHLTGTPETLIIRKGKIDIDLYAMDKSFLGTWRLDAGDVVLLVSGGHHIRCLEDTILLEIKQGPYTGLTEKEYF